VVYTGPASLGPHYGAHGTVAKVAGVRGKSVHPDPSGIMTFVLWDDDVAQGVFTRMLQRERDAVVDTVNAAK
jgi:hypothetical protein